MKKIVLIMLVMFSGMLTMEAQKMDVPKMDDKTFYWKNGYGDIVTVNFINLTKTMSQEKCDSIIMYTLSKSKYRLKNKLSFVPVSITIMNADNGLYYVTVICRGKNAYGSELESKFLYLYTNTKSIRIVK